MANLLALSDSTFLWVKISLGLTAAVVLYSFGSRPLARHGLTAALSVYIALFGLHVITGLAAFGYVPASFVYDVGRLTNSIFG